MGLRATAGLAVVTAGGVLLSTPAPAVAQTIRLSIPPPPQNNVPAEVFTGTVKKFVDGETLQVDRMSPDGKSSGRMVLIHLYGVSTVPGSSLPRPNAEKGDKAERGTVASAMDLREAIVGRRVRVEVRGRSKIKNDQVAQNALVSLLPNDNNALNAPPSLPQQGAPTVAIVQTRPLNDATGVNRDLPRGPSQPNLATSPNVPAPPAATSVRKDDVLNYALVREGLARWNQQEAPDIKEFSEAEKDAQKSKRGFWSEARK
ncbi:MAG: thermonuclease family protein [Armatimonadota bacterium]